MRLSGLFLGVLLVATSAFGQCKAKVVGTEIDEKFGSVKVLTQYTLNGQAVDVDAMPCNNCIAVSGRYDEAQGTIPEIIALNESDRDSHCKNLIARNLSITKTQEIKDAKLTEKKKQNQALKKELDKIVNDERTVIEVVEVYKGIEIRRNANGTVTISDIAP